MEINHNFQTNIQTGLSQNELEQRLKKGLLNIQSVHTTKSYKAIFHDNLFTLFNFINIVLAGLILSIGSYKNLLFMGVVISNIIIGIIQEIRAKRVLDKLRLITQNQVQVIRDGTLQNIAIQELVLDDLLLLASGSQVCADSIVKEGQLEVNESLITGESDIVIKRNGDFLYSGSFVVSGNAKVQVIHVGDENYAQTIVKDAKTFKKHKSQLRDSINFIIKSIGIIIIPMGILLFSKQFFITNCGYKSSIVATVAALIGMIPEGLVLLTSIALAVGSLNLAKKKTLVQELYCIETLARVDVLCLDKTGTITEGNMRVEQLIQVDDTIDCKEIIAQIMSILKDDNASAKAIRNFASKPVQHKQPLECFPFSSTRKCSGICFEDGTYLIGAYDFICKKQDSLALKTIQTQAQLGNRVLVVTHNPKHLTKDCLLDEANEVLAFLILSDPIREQAPATLDYFMKQGVDLKIISGDDPQTVHEIARKANLRDYDRYIDMSKVNNQDIDQIVKQYSVFGRVSPEQKKLMIQSLKKQGHICAMIGDGVNDVMALKEADCSISLAQGSEASKNIANLVLLDNNFSNMPHIVNEGRRVINNIQRSSSLFLVKTTFSTILSFLTIFILQNYPFQPIQLTLISSLTIGIPSFFLALEANYARVEGDFLINVLSRAFPGALSVVASIIYINLLSLIFSFNLAIKSTMCVLMTGTSLIFVLYRICKPFTKKRIILFSLMSILFIISILFFGNFFNLVRLPLFPLLLTVAGICVIPLFMNLCYIMGQKLRLKQRILNHYHKYS